MQTTVTVEAYRANGSTIGTTSVVVQPQRGIDLELATSLGFDLGNDTYGGSELRVR